MNVSVSSGDTRRSPSADSDCGGCVGGCTYEKSWSSQGERINSALTLVVLGSLADHFVVLCRCHVVYKV